jgi:hypothetical protein
MAQTGQGHHYEPAPAGRTLGELVQPLDPGKFEDGSGANDGIAGGPRGMDAGARSSRRWRVRRPRRFRPRSQPAALQHREAQDLPPGLDPVSVCGTGGLKGKLPARMQAGRTAARRKRWRQNATGLGVFLSQAGSVLDGTLGRPDRRAAGRKRLQGKTARFRCGMLGG